MKSFHLFVASLLWGGCTSAEVSPEADGNKKPPEITEKSLLATLAQAKEFLQTDNSSDEKLYTKFEGLLSKDQELETMQASLKEKQETVDNLVRQANAKQLEFLASRLNETLDKEVKLRRSIEEQADNLVEDSTTIDTVSISDVKSRLDVSRILDQSEKKIQTWMLEIMKDEVEKYKIDLLTNKGAALNCPSVADVVQDVHMALTKFSQDGIGLIDHAQGGEIVHSLTSATYSPQPHPYELLGNVWWRKYIPEDWEKLLPAGWEDWNTGIPSYIYHTLSVKGAKAAPPETILEKKTVPGSCWPLDGSKGQVTMRLPYPVFIDSVTIDHVNMEIVRSRKHQAAPKTMKIIGYPACGKGDECYALGLDMHDPIEIARIEYDIEASTIQTFDTIYAQASTIDSIDDSGEEEGSCSVEQAACNAPPRVSMGGITLKVLDNWGNEEYTCLYRLRVHGQPDL